MFVKATESWSPEQRQPVLAAVGIWIFFFAKTVKLMGHFVRYPADFIMLPVSITFGYVHGVLKLVGLLTLSEVSEMVCRSRFVLNQSLQTAWGSRDGADDDDRYRMIRLPPYDTDEAHGLVSREAEPVKSSLEPQNTLQHLPPYQTKSEPFPTSTNDHD